jgi:hypothetical protein
MPPNELGDWTECAAIFRVGKGGPKYTQPDEECLDTDGKLRHVQTDSTKCEDGTILYWNEYGWWKQDDTILIYPYQVVRSVGDDGQPPDLAVERCQSPN